MKRKTKVVSISLFLSVAIMLGSFDEQRAEWKGKIEYENGEEYCFDVFDSEGRYIAKIPLNFKPHMLKKEKIYTIEEDEDGYQYVKRYKVTWKY